MSFGNSGGSVDTSGYSFDGGLGSYGNSGFENVPVGGLSTDSNGYQVLPGDLTGGSSGGMGNILKNLGRIGLGALSGLSSSNAQNQQTYIPRTRWLGNGLATTEITDNLRNKLQQQNQNYGQTLMLGSLFGSGKDLGSVFTDDNNNLTSLLKTYYGER